MYRSAMCSLIASRDSWEAKFWTMSKAPSTLRSFWNESSMNALGGWVGVCVRVCVCVCGRDACAHVDLHACVCFTRYRGVCVCVCVCVYLAVLLGRRDFGSEVVHGRDPTVPVRLFEHVERETSEGHSVMLCVRVCEGV